MEKLSDKIINKREKNKIYSHYIVFRKAHKRLNKLTFEQFLKHFLI